MWLLIVGSVFAAPVCPASAAEFSSALEDAEKAFARMDPLALTASLSDAEAELACTEGPLPPVAAARLHRVKALAHFVAGNEVEARRALYAARVLDPAGGYPASVVAADHPIHALEPAPSAQPAPFVAVPAPASGTVSFDGHPGLQRPADRPTVYQITGPRGATLQGAYVVSDAALPPFPTAALPTATRTVARTPHTSVPLAIAGAVGLLGAGVTYGLAGASHARFEDPSTDLAAVPGLYRRTNTLVYTSVGLTAVGVAGGATALLVGKW
jgi:hypothetical protein